MKITLFKYWHQDLFGGLTAGIVALPLALAFGVQSGLGAAAGLYGAIFLGFFASLLGGTAPQVSGPTGPMTVITTLVVAAAVATAGSLQEATGIILFTFVLAGLFQIILGLCRVGGYIKYIPYPVLSGFMTGIGLIIIALQIFPAIGLGSPSTVMEVVTQLPSKLSEINYVSLILTVVTYSIILIWRRMTRKIPATLMALMIVSVISTLMDANTPLIGSIPIGLPQLQLGNLFTIQWSELPPMVAPALTLAALGCIDSLLTSIFVDNITKTTHNSDKELIGQGIGNTISAIFGGIPGAGATMRTMANMAAGGKTKLSGMIHSLLLLAILLFLGRFAEKIPLCVLAAILVDVGIGIIDYKGLKHIRNVPVPDVIVMFIVITLTVFVNLLYAVAVGMILSSLLFMKKMGDIAAEKTQLSYLKDLSPGQFLHDETQFEDYLGDQVYIKHLYGPLFFGFTAQFQELIQTIPDVKLVVLRMNRVPYIDQSGIYAIEDAVHYLYGRGIETVIVGIQSQPLDMLRRIELIPGMIPEERVFPSMLAAFEWARDYIDRGRA